MCFLKVVLTLKPKILRLLKLDLIIYIYVKIDNALKCNAVLPSKYRGQHWETLETVYNSRVSNKG